LSSNTAAAIRKWLGEKTTIAGLALIAGSIVGYCVGVPWQTDLFWGIVGIVGIVLRENPQQAEAQIRAILDELPKILAAMPATVVVPPAGQTSVPPAQKVIITPPDDGAAR
jgi:hypothetical protein